MTATLAAAWGRRKVSGAFCHWGACMPNILVSGKRRPTPLRRALLDGVAESGGAVEIDHCGLGNETPRGVEG